VAPKEHATVETGKLLMKWHKGRNPATEQRGELKELTRRDCGSGKKLAAACKKVSSCATVSWRPYFTYLSHRFLEYLTVYLP
jgi:hypothetical protein